MTCEVRKESKIEDELRQPGRKCGRKLGRADGKVVGIRKRRRLRKFQRHTYRRGSDEEMQEGRSVAEIERKPI